MMHVLFILFVAHLLVPLHWITQTLGQLYIGHLFALAVLHIEHFYVLLTVWNELVRLYKNCYWQILTLSDHPLSSFKNAEIPISHLSNSEKLCNNANYFFLWHECYTVLVNVIGFQGKLMLWWNSMVPFRGSHRHPMLFWLKIEPFRFAPKQWKITWDVYGSP